jgi:hypothetical protein
MGTYLLSQLRHRPARAAALGLGILVSAVSFTLLTAAIETGQLRVTGAISRNFRPAYDILVRPAGSFTDLERSRDLVQSNYLSGIFGGISFEQYRSIRGIQGVEVAAPIANIGWIMPFQQIPIPISRFLSLEAVQMYRLRFDWLANNRLSRYPDAVRFVYYTRGHRFVRIGNGLVAEVLGSGVKKPACLPFALSKESVLLTSNPFSVAADTSMTCFSERTPGLQWPVSDQGPLPHGRVGEWAFVFYPMLISAIDPTQELRLIDLDGAVVDGRMLDGDDRVGRVRDPGGLTFRTVPLLVSDRTYLDETLQVVVDRLQLPSEPTLHRALSSEARAYNFVRHLNGREVGRLEVSAQDIYEHYLRTLASRVPRRRITYDGYWTSSPIEYQSQGSDRLLARTRRNPARVFETVFGAGWAPADNRDLQYRRLVRHAGSIRASGTFLQPSFRVVGRFDPELLPGFSPLSEVPLETYYPPRVTPASPEGQHALGGRPLLPSMNIGGYVSQPPLMLTNLKGLRAFVDTDAFEGADQRAPISVIRVRVSGVTGPDPLSRERIRRVAELIHRTTNLAVDITAGSSPRSLLVRLPTGKFGQPELLVQEDWVQKGVAVRFLRAVDRKSLLLFFIVLVVTIFFLINGSLASVRLRRVEIGTLSCMGWTRSKVFFVVAGELGIVGFAAGLAGAGLAALLISAFSLDVSMGRSILVVPTATLVAILAGLLPAWRASHGVPIDAVTPPVSARSGLGVVRTITSMALSNTLRVPWRAVLGALGLFVGIGALTFLLSVNIAFEGVLFGTVLGDAISVEVRGIDLLSVLLAICLAGLSVADLVFLNVRERAPELMTLRAAGWTDAHIGRLVALEGSVIGLFGAVPGALAGMALAGTLGGLRIGLVWAGLVAAFTGALVAIAASLLTSAFASRKSVPSVLAAE